MRENTPGTRLERNEKENAQFLASGELSWAGIRSDIFEEDSLATVCSMAYRFSRVEVN